LSLLPSLIAPGIVALKKISESVHVAILFY